MELKSTKLITRNSFRRNESYRELVEAVFELCRNLPLRVFAIAMERPKNPVPQRDGWLPTQFRYLLQRVHHEAVAQDDYATILFDGDDVGQNGLATKFEHFLFRSQGGAALNRIADAPYFVDSKITAGIQIADLMASVIRQYEENDLFRGIPDGDPYLSAIARFYVTITGLTRDVQTDEGVMRGLYRMPERGLYHHPEDELPQGVARRVAYEGQKGGSQ